MQSCLKMPKKASQTLPPAGLRLRMKVFTCHISPFAHSKSTPPPFFFFFLCNPTDFNSSPVDLNDLRKEDRETELHRGQGTARKVQAQIKQLLQDQGFDATLSENQAKELILQVTNSRLYLLLFSLLSIIVTSTYSFTIFPCLYPHRASEKFVSHKNFTDSVLNKAMTGGPICTSPGVEQIHESLICWRSFLEILPKRPTWKNWIYPHSSADVQLPLLPRLLTLR